MEKPNFQKSWDAFIHWKGWQACGRCLANGWKKTAGWSGWKRIFFLPLWAAVPLFAVCGVLLIWIFAQGMDRHFWTMGLYVLSAYLLIVLCIKLPTGLKNADHWMARHPKLLGVVQNKELKFTVGLYLEQLINFAYGGFKIITGIVVGSAWIGSDGIYNFAQALIQLFQILRRKKLGTVTQQWKSYRTCGVLILLMHLTLVGIVFQTVNWNRVEESGEIMIIATAAFAFYKFISSFVDLAKDRKHTHPVDSSVRMLKLSQAIFAIFSLQAGMLRTFGTGENWEHWINLIVGCAACLLTIVMGIYMVHRGNREIKKLEVLADGTKVF